MPLLKKKSLFLLGPRATGKSFLIREQLGQEALKLDLLKSDLYLRLSSNPSELTDLVVASGKSRVVIDEVQKIPTLLDEVHRLIEEKGIHFLLTGSSARKLKRGNANLLAGRAWMTHLFPLTWNELKKAKLFSLERYLRFGGLPAIYLSEDPEEELNAYARTYLYEEIQAEGLVRKLPAFSRFLKTAALSNGQMINFASVASDAGVPAATVREYYSILEDTLVGFALEPWVASKKRRAIQTSKFFFFDTGVSHLLAGTRTIDRNSDLYGRSFEHWIGMEIRAFLSYSRNQAALGYWRSTHHHEVDFVIDDHTAIEVKATRRTTEKDLKGLRAIAEEKKFRKLYLVSEDPHPRRVAGTPSIEVLRYDLFLERLWSGEITPG